LLALTWSATTHALDANDRLTLTLDGGERIEGWFVRAEAKAVVVSVPGLRDTTRVPIDLIRTVSSNGVDLPMPQFRDDAVRAHLAWKAWVTDPPPHPHTLAVVIPSLVIPGAGQAALGESRSAWGYFIGDLVLLGAGALELTNDQRLGVLMPIAALNVLLRINSASDAARVTNRRRRRLREARAILQDPTQR